MPYLRTLLALLLFTSLAAADELRTLGGKTHTGTVASIDDKEIVIKTADGDVTVPLAEILALNLRAAKGVPPGVKYTDVKLLDDTVLHCAKVALTGNQAELTLLAGQVVKLSMASIVLIQNDAQDPAVRKEWDAILKEKTKRDRIIIKRGDELNPLEGTLGDADKEGKTISFRRETGEVLPVKLDVPAGLIFYRNETLTESPVCNVYDMQGNVLAAAKIALEGNSYTITTPAGVKLTYEQTALAKFDYNLGKLTYLSDMEPAKVVERSGVGLAIAYKKDANLDGEPIQLADKQFAKGLSMHAYTELEYNLNGKYKEFRATLGVDGRVGSESQATVTIERDGEKVFSEVVTAKSMRALVIPIRDASRLRIIVSSRNFLDLHDHATLADAKISQ